MFVIYSCIRNRHSLSRGKKEPAVVIYTSYYIKQTPGGEWTLESQLWQNGIFRGKKKAEQWTLSNILEIKTADSQKSRFNSTVSVLTCAAGKCATLWIAIILWMFINMGVKPDAWWLQPQVFCVQRTTSYYFDSYLLHPLFNINHIYTAHIQTGNVQCQRKTGK